MPIKSVKMKISKNKKMCFFLMSQGSLNPKIRYLGQKVCSVACVQTQSPGSYDPIRIVQLTLDITPPACRHRKAKTATKVNTEDTLSGCEDLSLFNLSSRIGHIIICYYDQKNFLWVPALAWAVCPPIHSRHEAQQQMIAPR